MLQKLPSADIERRKNLFKFDEELIQDYEENTEKGCILEVDVKYSRKRQELPSDMQF